MPFGFGFKLAFRKRGGGPAPATVPGAPSSLLAVNVNCDTDMNLTWDAPGSGGSPITGYKIERKVGAGSYSTLVADTGNTNTNYTDTGLTAGTQYTYRVYAINAIGTGVASNTSDDTIDDVPGQVTGLAVLAQDDDAINLSWSAPASNGGCAISGYKIERESPVGGGFSTIVADTGTTGTTYSNSGLTAGTQYNYRVSAINSIGTGTASAAANTKTYDADSMAYLNAHGDVPSNGAAINARIATDKLVKAIKAAGVWSKGKAGYLSLPSLDDTNAELNLFTATKTGTLQGTVTTGNRGDMLAPYSTGYAFDSNDYFETGVVPSTAFTLNSSCIMIGIVDNLAASANYECGALTTTSQDMIFSTRFTGNVTRGDMYNITVGQGRQNIAGTTLTRGRWVFNRNANNYFEVTKDNSILGTITTSGGTLPTHELYWSGYNNAGTVTLRLRGIRSYFFAFDGLTTTERSAVDAALAQFDIDMGYRINYTKQLLLDGNSYTRYQNEKLYRTIQYNLWNNGGEPNVFYYKNFGVNGQTVSTMKTNYPTNIAPLYNAGYGQNVLAVVGVSNGLYQGGTVAQVWQDIQDYCALAKATGYFVLLSTMVARTQVGNTGRTATQFYLAWDELNDLIRNSSGVADVVMDIELGTGVAFADRKLVVKRSEYASDAAFVTGMTGLINNGTIYDQADDTHLTDAGSKYQGDQLYQLGFSLLPNP